MQLVMATHLNAKIPLQQCTIGKQDFAYDIKTLKGHEKAIAIN